MKITRIVFVLFVVAAIATVAAYLYSNRNTTTSTNVPGGAQAPSDAVVFSDSVPVREMVIEASEYKFTPNTITIKKGESVKITLKNAGTMAHDWSVENMGGASIDMTNAGATNSIVIKASQTGTFTTYCSVGSHRKLGMVGKLIVQ